MDVEIPIFIETDSSEWPDKFIRRSDGALEDATDECYRARGVLACDLIETNMLNGFIWELRAVMVVKYWSNSSFYMDGLFSLRFQGRPHRSGGYWW